MGYNGPPFCIDDDEVDWERPGKYAWLIHAEINAILRHDVRGWTLYVTGIPCSRCILILAQAGIRTIVYGSNRPNVCDTADEALMRKIADAAGIELIDYEEVSNESA